MKAPKCHTTTCDAEPTVIVFWPGQTSKMCAVCAVRAVNLASVMGFRVAVAPIETGETLLVL